MKLRARCPPHKQWGYADFFDSRRKRQILALAETKPWDVLYDMGCGDASFLIFAVEEFGIRKAIGFENMPQRMALARRNIRKHRLQHAITIEADMYKADLTKADIIFDMMLESEDDLEKLYSNKIRNGTRLIKHDLSLLGFIPDKKILPFYRMTFPLVKASSKDQWASAVLGKKDAIINDLWYELYYYGFEKIYNMWDIKRMRRTLAGRLLR